MTDCAEGLPWPVLDRVRFMGLPGKIDESSVVFEIMTPGKIHPLRSIPIKPSKVSLPSSSQTTVHMAMQSVHQFLPLTAHSFKYALVICCRSYGLTCNRPCQLSFDSWQSDSGTS